VPDFGCPHRQFRRLTICSNDFFLPWSAKRVENRPIDQPGTLHSRIVSGSFVLLVGSGLATATNLAYNIAVARFLGPAGFGHATAVYTLLVLISAATLSIQIVSAKLVAQQQDVESRRAVYRSFHRVAWVGGIGIALLLLAFRSTITGYLNLPTSDLVSLLAVGAAFYVPLGSRRGYIQGSCAFRGLATNLVLEGITRLGGSLAAVLLGYGVRGVIAANSAAIAVAYLAAVQKPARRTSSPLPFRVALRETGQALIFFAGQVLINNCDIVLVKHFFLSREAGLYAAVAMVGRVIFTFCQSVVNSMFPLVAGTRAEERRGFKVIITSFLMVLGIGSILALALRLAPAWLWTSFFGSGFAIAGKYGLPYLLAMYAMTTILYCLCVVLITYEMSYRIANTSWIQLGFSGIIIAGICLFHNSLREVILVQLILMIVLLAAIGIPFILRSMSSDEGEAKLPGTRSIRILRRISEDEAIAAFLHGEINNPAFHEYRDVLRDIIVSPNCDDPVENAKRRALLFIRHYALWKELPRGTEWYEIQLRPEDLSQIRVFPRAQWRKLAKGGGDYSITRIADLVMNQPVGEQDQFQSKIGALRDRLLTEEPGLGTVILIGLNENEPLTVLDGNHRLLAAMFASPEQVGKLRVLCGLSPRMSYCCWYNTNLFTLFRYGRSIFSHIANDPEAELARLLQSAG
jgi:O-antigen/teichoic acid export membrane protein